VCQDITPFRKGGRHGQSTAPAHYSPRTIETYTECIHGFARHFGTSPARLGPEEIRTYQRWLIDEKRVSWASFNQTVSALRFLYGATLDRKDVVTRIPYPKHETKLPVVLSVEEVGRLFRAVENLKHRTILMLLYSAGLRLSDGLGLVVTDIDSQRMVIRVEQGKGRQDRYADLTPSLLTALRVYWKAYRPTHYLFPGTTGDRPLSPSAVQKACSHARRRAALTKRVSPHTLRHCYASCASRRPGSRSPSTARPRRGRAGRSAAQHRPSVVPHAPTPRSEIAADHARTALQSP
jgi:site-specific recombinase XerD